MKKLIVFGGVSLSLLFSAALATGDEVSVQGLYQEGVAAMKKGDGSLAQMKFAKVLKLDPSHGDARLQLIRLKKDKDKISGLAKKHELKNIIIKDIDLRQASLSDSLEHFDNLIAKKSKKTMNFIIQDPTGELGSKKISLRLKEVPSSVVLDYILQAAGAKATFRKHAIEISPAS